jgi:hypothetical protein
MSFINVMNEYHIIKNRYITWKMISITLIIIVCILSLYIAYINRHKITRKIFGGITRNRRNRQKRK